MILPSKIAFQGALIDQVILQPNEDGGKAVLALSAPLPANLAGALKVQEMFYDQKGIIREWTGSVGLPGNFTDYQIDVGMDGGMVRLSPDKVHCFKVSTEDVNDGGKMVTLNFRAHFSAEDEIDKVWTFARATNKDTFGCELFARQGELFNEAVVDGQFAEVGESPEPVPEEDKGDEDEPPGPVLATMRQMEQREQTAKTLKFPTPGETYQ